MKKLMSRSDRAIGWYVLGYIPCLAISFLVLWYYMIQSWGLGAGVLVGWVPALLGALIVSLAWPVFALMLLLLIVVALL